MRSALCSSRYYKHRNSGSRSYYDHLFQKVRMAASGFYKTWPETAFAYFESFEALWGG